MVDEARRTAALSIMMGRFPAVAERVKRVYGLRVPRHLAVFCAFWLSTDDAQRQALRYLGLSPFGLCDYFADDQMRLVAQGGLDERLHGRFRRDPAEFVTVLAGGVDGLHYGLWYDDPAELPSFVAHNYARAEGETWTDGCPTLLTQLRCEIARRLTDGVDGEARARRLAPLSAAVEWFAAADEQALADDGPRRWTADDRLRGGISISPAIPAGGGDPRLDQSLNRATCFVYGVPHARQWIAEAEHELAAGLPAYALAVGGELHWADNDEYRQQARDLLVGAYHSLNRPALAEIIDVHVAHRDLPSVQILVPSDG